MIQAATHAMIQTATLVMIHSDSRDDSSGDSREGGGYNDGVARALAARVTICLVSFPFSASFIS